MAMRSKRPKPNFTDAAQAKAMAVKNTINMATYFSLSTVSLKRILWSFSAI